MTKYLTGSAQSKFLSLIYELSKQKNQHDPESPELTLEEIARAIQTIPEFFYVGAQLVDPEAFDADFIRPDIESLLRARGFVTISEDKVRLTRFGFIIARTFRLPSDVTEALETLQ